MSGKSCIQYEVCYIEYGVSLLTHTYYWRYYIRYKIIVTAVVNCVKLVWFLASYCNRNGANPSDAFIDCLGFVLCLLRKLKLILVCMSETMRFVRKKCRLYDVGSVRVENWCTWQNCLYCLCYILHLLCLRIYLPVSAMIGELVIIMSRVAVII